MPRLMLAALLLAPPAAAAAPPEEVRGALVVAGGGRLPDAARAEFVRLAGGKGKARIVVVPTASRDAGDPAQADGFLAPWRPLDPAAVDLLHAADRAAAAAPGFTRPLTEATAVWFSGGDQNRLTATYSGTPVEAEVRKLLARGGVVGGTSAGAAVVSDPMIAGGNPDAKTAPGFGLLPGIVVDQHFTERGRLPRLRRVLDRHPGRAGLGVDERTAVVVAGRSMRVVGDGTATIVWAKSDARPAREEVHRAGGGWDLVQVRRAAAARAARPEFPPKDPPAPVVPGGSMVIAGGGGLGPDIVRRFLDLAGGPAAPIVVIPTAQDDPLAADHPEANLLRRHGATAVRTLHTRDRKAADDPEFSTALLDAKGVWFGGGRQWRLVDAYEGTLAERRARDVLARGGVVGGSSAGASIQGEYMPRGHPLGNTVVMAEGYERGFGYLPGTAIDQHFFARNRAADMTALMTAYPQYLGIGIDEGTAIVVRGHTAEVVGRSKAAFYDYRHGRPAGDKDYAEVPAGGRYDLEARKPVP